MASTAAASAAFSSPRPISFDAAIAAASVTRTISSTSTRSRTRLADGSARFMKDSPCGNRPAIGALLAVVHRVLQKLGADPHGARRDRCLHQKNRKCRAYGEHGGHEQPGDLRAEA